MDLARSTEVAAVEVLAETTASPRYQAGLRDDIRKDGRSIAVVEFTSSILAHTVPTTHGIGLARTAGSQGKSNRSLGIFVVA
jgi:hypothetical protein